MSATWNGLALRLEYATMLGDVKSSFLTKTLGWMNDVIDEIHQAHAWGFSRVKGKKVLTASAEEHDLFITPPTAPTIAAAAGGSLTTLSTYKVAVTFVEGTAQMESKRGTASSGVTLAANLTLNVTAIPVSGSTLCTARKIYLQKDSGAWYLYETISNNTATTTTISADTTDTTEAPDRNNIIRLDGAPFFESGPSRQMDYRALDQLRLLFQGAWSTGSPAYWADVWHDRIALYPAPNSAYTVSFYCHRYPNKVYASVDSQPDLPQSLRYLLRQGVKAKGYEFRERADWKSEREDFFAMLANAISTHGTTAGGIPATIRDTQGNSDGFEI
jgi:hypothetical protein